MKKSKLDNEGVMRGHYAIFSEYDLDEFCL